jgi:predicted RNA-binding Zn ribbon-like protein
MNDRKRIIDAGYAARRAAIVGSALLGEPMSDQEVAALLEEQGERPPVRVTPEDHEALRGAALRLREVFAAPNAGSAATALNQVLSAYARPPHLTNDGGRSTWHLHVHDDDRDSMADWFAASSALALATLLVERQRLPGGVCAAPDCERLFIDLGRGMPRRYCSERCATRTRVAAFRSRQAAA